MNKYFFLLLILSILSVALSTVSEPTKLDVQLRSPNKKSQLDLGSSSDKKNKINNYKNTVQDKIQRRGGVEEVPEGKMSMAASIFNLSKNIIGGGMLALPAGMAAGKGTGWLSAVALVAASGLGSAYTFYLIGKCAHYTKSPDFRTLWDRTLGESSSWLIDWAFLTLMGGVSVMYSCFVGDLFGALGELVPGLPPALAARNPAMVLVSAAVLVPLCLLRDLSALGASSLAGLAAVLYTAAFVGLRLRDGSYAAPAGKFLVGLGDAVKPALANVGGPLSLGLGCAVLVNMLATAYMAHPNGVKFYNELERRSFPRFAAVVGAANALASALYVFVMLAGFRTFGMNCQGLILNNYHGSADKLGTLARAATGVSILTSYPFAFVAFRGSFVSILKSYRAPSKAQNEKGLLEKLGDAAAGIDTNNKTWTAVTLALMAATTGVSLVTKDVGLVVSLLGSLLGAGIIFSMPTAMYLCVLRQDKSIPRSTNEVAALHLLALLGGLLAAGGTAVTLLDSFTDVFK
ncbi:unnamed protein product [Heterosigma akashiwo]|mmetsp:Transcript_24389/g.33748  ORF Transcript_24389/g.33748 Transcript_24389/m.33748 type:complete len:517 (+) Transcript_24389:63-1613(+)